MSGTSVTSDRALALEAGRHLACAPPGEEVVISGIAGFFPDSDNVADFGDKLFNKVDLISDDDRRWKLEHPEIPQRTGKLNEVNKFDAAFFGVHFKQAHTMDPMCRMLLEKAYEAIVDSGYNPRHLRGTRTGVFVGACFSESEKTWFYEKLQVNGFGITGCSRAMLANRISYWLGINGPSYTVDSACSSSLYALEHAYKSIRDGHCDAAIVGGCNLCLHPYVSLQFARLGVLSQDGRCKCFDEAANGYCRSEAVAIVYLQKAKNARRVYATVVHAKTNCDGYKEQGITFPSGPLQQRLLEEFYEECQISPSSLAWVEAHGTGTTVGDPEEVKALENVFCPGRTTPLPIGSVKSNIGHSEPASGLCSVTKVLIAMESGFIPPNINFKNPRKDIDAFFNGKINVVTEKTAWDGGMVGINSFGFGGANCHVLLKWNEKSKKNGGAPDDDIPRVIPTSGRTENAVDVILTDVESRGIDIEFVKLLHEVHADDIPGHIYRGFTVMSKNCSARMRSIKYYPGDKRPVWFIFSGMGSQWAGMGADLMKIPVFASAIQLCHQTLAPKGIDLIRIITDPDPTIFDNILNSFVGIAAIQIGLVDVLTTIGIVPDHLIGHSVGELGCAYADGCFTAQQMILAAYYRGLASLQSKLIPGAMAAVGMGYNDIRDMVPAEIDIACHNSAGSCTISGPAAVVQTFVKKLQDQKIFAREVNVSKIAYHSRYIAPAGPKLLAYLKQVVPNPKPRSAKWVSSSVPETQWDSPQAKLCSAEYHTNNLLNPVLFEEASRHIHPRAIAVEIAPHGLLQAILRRSLDKQTVNIPLTQKDSPNNSVVLMSALGKLYEAGLTPHFAALYPEVPLPVSRGTPMIAPLVRWEHSEEWYVTSYRMQEKIKSGERTVNINLKDDELEYLGGHVIDGRNLYPATGYLALAWETVGLMRGELYTDVSVVFEDIRFHRATNLPKDGSVDFIVMVQKGSGNFEIVEGGAAIVTGRIYVPDNINKEVITLDPPEDEKDPSFLEMTGKDFYKELRLRGYNYKGLFRSVTKANNTGTIGQVGWHNNWVAFMDNMLQMQIIREDTRGLFVPTSIQKLVIDVKKHVQILFSLPDEDKEVPVYVYNYLDLIKCGGVQIEGLKASAIARRKPLGEPVLEKYQFFPHISQNKDIDLSTYTRMCVHLALDNILVTKVKCVELLEGSDPDAELLSPFILQILGDLPLLQADISILSPADNPKVADLVSNITVEDKKLPSDQSTFLVVASNLFAPSRAEVLKSCLGAIREDGYVLSREKINDEFDFTGFTVCMERTIESEKLILFKKSQQVKGEQMVIKIPADDYSWVGQVQAAFKSDAVSRVLLYAEKEPTNGIIGLVNCLRKEPGGEKTSCVFVLDPKAPAFSTEDQLYQTQLAKNLAINVFKDGVWGSFRHFPIDVLTPTDVDHAFVNTVVRGDLSSLSWLQGPLSFNEVLPKERELVHIYYSALNFRDVMMMTGKIAPEVITRDRREQDCMCGFEFAGRTSKGKRVMGMTNCRCLSNTVVADPMLLWDVPDEWTLEQAASVPVVYGTAIFALYTCGNMKRGDSVLIHAGTGGVGQAAIYLALHEGCTVFTTVGTPEKREFIKKTFPQIKESHIGNSRDCSFETMVMTETDGCGVDLVLNSLAEEKLLASVRCLARNGRFLEIGKFDLANNNPLGMETFLKGTSFHGIQLDTLFITPQSSRKLELQDMVTESIKSGAVKPLCTTVFKEDQVEQAFRYMASGKHVGKVLVKIRDDDSQVSCLPKPVKMLARNRFFCKTNASYIIIGGLGGFGLELGDWLALRGCKKLILTSRSGLRSGYQAMRIRIWKSYGVDVQISTVDVTTEQGVRELLKQANSLAPVGGIFNLAVVLRDALFENQTPADFEASAGPKALATKLLDKLSRKMCPSLTHFIIFSSVSCGRGNAGQTNYGLSNSVMERICEQRQADGLPALAVQWGAVGEVGLVADMQEDNLEVVIGGTLQQRINSCLEVLDGFMFCPYPVVASMVVAEKRAGGGVAGNIVDTVVNILGLRDLKTISLHSTLAELGMDSMMAVEIKQTLEREFQVFLTAQDIRGMTFAKLQDLAAQTENESNTGAPKVSDTLPDFGINHLLRVVGDEMLSGEPILRLPSLCGDGKTIEEISTNDDLIFLIPGIEGVASIVEPLAKNLKAQALCLQFDYEKTYDTIGDIAEGLLPHIKKRLRPGATFKLMGYSFGAMVALEIVHRLEAEGRRGHVWLIDGAPDFLQALSRKTMHAEDEKDGFEALQIQLIHTFMDLIWPQDKATFESELLALPNWDARVEYLVEKAPVGLHSKRFQRLSMHAAYHKILAIFRYKPLPNKCLASSVMLIRPSEMAIVTEDDYGLSKYCQSPVSVRFVDGNHMTILDNKKTADLINKPNTDDAIGFKQSIMSTTENSLSSLQDEAKQK